MKKLLIVAIIALGSACGSKPAPVTPANKTTDADKKAGSMGGTGYGGGSAMKPPATSGDPCAM